jgi:hypothetical protein
MQRHILMAGLVAAAVCGAACTAGPDPDPDPGPGEPGPCDAAEDLLGQRVCVHDLDSWDLWQELAIPSPAHDQLALTKYLSPATDTARLPALFMDVNVYSLHYDLLVEAFPDDFVGLSHGEYNDLILAQGREFVAGSLVQFSSPQEPIFGFTVLDDPADDDATATYEQVLATWLELSEHLGLGQLAFIPTTGNQLQAAAGWSDAFPIHGQDTSITYEVYTRAEGYGTLRLYTLDDLAAATAAVEFGLQDILVLDEAPADIERVISGAVTGTRQGELSHLNVRSAARGTPNCYIPTPHETLAQWQGQLVRLECGDDALSIEATTLAEAEAFWEALRPEPIQIPAADTSWSEMQGLLEVPTSNPEERAEALARYGSKGANLAALYQLVDPSIQLQGFLVPFQFYDQFMAANTWSVDLGSGEAQHSFADTLTSWLADPGFLSDGLARRNMLSALRAAVRASAVDASLIDLLDARIRAVFGGDTTMVRFRSSSNAEDALEFSGAGIYDSTSACLADERDKGSDGPSLCDADQDNERDLSRALLKVWASLWNMEAFEERDWYGIDHSATAMGVLVNARSKNERANIVAFTGNPTNADDDRMLINAQIGELDVVSAGPGVVPEKVLLELSGGSVSEIVRVSPSSVVLPGTQVLSDSQLQDLGAHLWSISEGFPVDGAVPADRDLLLDTEWKVLEDGRLIIKQVRPFLR